MILVMGKRKSPKKTRQARQKRPRYLVDRFLIQSMLADKGWSETEYARQAGIDQPTVSRILSGQTRQPTQATLAKLARPLGLEGGALIKRAPALRETA